VTRIDVAFVLVEPGSASEPSTLADLADADLHAIGRLGIAADRDRSATARAAARRALGQRLGMNPTRVPLETSPFGQPRIKGSSIGLSWAHSGRWVALGIAQEGPVGVDIERRMDIVPLKALRAFGLQSLEEFVAREAAGKATGQGLGETWPAGVTVRPLLAPAGYVAAVAARDESMWINCDGVNPPHPARLMQVWRFGALNGWAYPDDLWSAGFRSRASRPGRRTPQRRPE
jgi:hypothetical protein